MGNRLAVLDVEDCQIPEDVKPFFTKIRITWVENFIFQLKQIDPKASSNMLNQETTISWKNYFQIFGNIKKVMNVEDERSQRKQWHLACSGYIMQKTDQPELPRIAETTIPDDFTEDEPSDVDEDEEVDAAGDEAKRSVDGAEAGDADIDGRTTEENRTASDTSVQQLPPKSWDPTKVSPIFFGYTTVKADEVERERIEKDQKLERAEHEAIERIRVAHTEALKDMATSMKTREAIRVRKIEEMKAKYEKARKKKQEELEKQQKTLPDFAFKAYKIEWENDRKASEEAEEAEITLAQTTHERMSRADRDHLLLKTEELEAFKTAEAQEFPSAEKLEQIARVEVAHWTEELATRCTALEAAHEEFEEVHRDLLALKDKSKDRSEAMAVRSMMNVSETILKQKQKAVEESIRWIDDCEMLMKRAVHLRSLQDEFQPLFRRIAAVDLPRACRLDLLMAALVSLCSDTFDRKFNFVFELFKDTSSSVGSDRMQLFGFKYLVNVTTVFHEALYRAQYLTFPVNSKEVNNIMHRAYLDMNLSETDGLTNYECRQLFERLFFWSQILCNLFSVTKNDKFCTYQRNRMSPFALMTRGFVGPSSVKYRLHFELTRYRSLLDPAHRSVIHDRAMNLGENDPLKADYSRFIVKPKKKGFSLVVPLEHGHLSYLIYTRNKMLNEFALRIQRAYRGVRERRIAELAAKSVAFMEAKELAIQEMKQKVMNEFKKRENGTGVGKMKWDAQIRIKQAKLRTQGQAVSRAETVMVMMEEAIERARVEIEDRFNAIQEAEGYGADAALKKLKAIQESAPQAVNDVLGFSLFGVVFRASTEDQAATDAEALKNISTPSAVEERLLDEQAVQLADEAKAMEKFGQQRTMDMVRGLYLLDPAAKGETVMQREMRVAMSLADPETRYLYNRLRKLDKALTELRTWDLLLELPSKRLLMQFVNALTHKQLKDELTNHFLIFRNQGEIATYLKGMFRTDREAGLEFDQLVQLQCLSEAAIKSMVGKEVSGDVRKLEEAITRRLAVNEETTEEEIIRLEFERANSLTNKFIVLAKEALYSMDKLRDKLGNIMLSYLEMDKKRRSIEYLQKMKEGESGLTPIITMTHRQNWVTRLHNALRSDETTAEETSVKYTEVRSVTVEFLDQVRRDAIVIISEFAHPKHMKTIPVVQEEVVHGRAQVCGRGHEGKAYVFEAHNIVYRVCLDYHGIFNGSDDNAAKAAGNDRLGSMQYFKCHMEKLNVPLIATIDYYGYRVHAMAKLSNQRIMFTEEGDIRRITEDLVHGVVNQGQTFVNKNKNVALLLRQAANLLNLDDHYCKGMKDINAARTCASSEIHVYRGSDELYYAKDFWRAFPSEVPEETPHLTRSPRDQSVFWRLLRPEFCKTYEIPLSPDACCNIIAGTPDWEKQYNDAKKATIHLINVIVPSFVEFLCRKDFMLPLSEGLGIDLSDEFHQRGIGLRHIGLVRSLIWQELAGTVSLFFNNNFVLTQKDLRDEVRDGCIIRFPAQGLEFTVKESSRRKVTNSRIPIDVTYVGQSYDNTRARIGAATLDRNSENLRSLLLAEMVARAIKSIVRLHLRTHSAKTQGTNAEFRIIIICDYFNAVTGTHPNANRMLQDEVYESIRDKYGDRAVVFRERDILQTLIEPCIVYIIRRLQTMLGVQLTNTCVAEFHERPTGFSFLPVDVVEVTPIVRHNVPVLQLADAVLAGVRAVEADETTYVSQVLSDKPAVFFRLNERRGTRVASNLGTTRELCQGVFSFGCVLEVPGPIVSDPLSRAASFSSETTSRLDTKFHPLVTPQKLEDPFTVEAYVKVTGGKDTARVVLMSGRCSVVVDRENYFSFCFFYNVHDIPIRLAPAPFNVWCHVAVTFDGTIFRLYVDSVLVQQLEIEPLLHAKEDDYNDRTDMRKRLIDEEDARERELMKAKTREEAETYFKTKAGQMAMRSLALKFMASGDFSEELLDSIPADADEATAEKYRKREALIRVKKKYADDLYINNCQQVAGQTRLRYAELEDLIRREREDAVKAMRRALRVGASCPSAGSREGSDFFEGHIACVAVYPRCLSADRVRTHFLSAGIDRTRDAHRLYAAASMKYEEALSVAMDDTIVLRKYAAVLCAFLKIKPGLASMHGILEGKLRVSEAIFKFKNRQVPDGIGEIFKAIPREADYADLICQAFNTLLEMDPQYFASNRVVTRKDLIHTPQTFGLIAAESPFYFVETAANMYKEVVRELSICDSYGELNLHWLPELKSPELVVSVVRHAQDVGDLRSVRLISDLYQNPAEPITVSDEDVKVLATQLGSPVLFDFTRCARLTDAALLELRRLGGLRAVTLDHCTLITDAGLDHLSELYESLEALSIAGVKNITDDGIMPIAMSCKRLKLLNVNNCTGVSQESLLDVARNCRALHTLHASATMVSDHGLERLTHYLSGKHLTSVDLSFCRDVTDHSISILAEKCPNLVYLNCCAMSRITDQGVRAITKHCWALQYLNLEDLFLLNDDAFWYSHAYDGRQLADENMLKALTSLNLSDCVHLSDRGIEGIAMRCRSLQQLWLRGCDRLTDTALEFVSQQPFSPTNEALYPTSDTLKVIDLGLSKGFTAKGVQQFMAKCPVLEDVSLSAIVGLADVHMLEICRRCTSIQKLNLQRCILLTDNTMCAIADFLWLEHLDISFCNRITDEGIEILTGTSAGLLTLKARRVTRLTGVAVYAVSRNCRSIRELDVRECADVSRESVAELQRMHKFIIVHR